VHLGFNPGSWMRLKTFEKKRDLIPAGRHVRTQASTGSRSCVTSKKTLVRFG